MLFWTLSLALSALVALVLVRALFRGGAGRSEAEADLQVYRDQLKEVERDLARGVIGGAEAERARIEISRRLLEADRAGRGGAGRNGVGQSGPAAGRGSPVVPVVLVAAAVAGAVALYRLTGAPGYPDLPIAERIARAETFRESRPSQAAAEAEATAGAALPDRPAPDQQYLDLVKRLRKAVAERPDDLTGQRLLARNEAALGNFAAAIAAQRRVIELSGKGVTAEDYAVLADDMILATGGYVSPEAEDALARALQLDPRSGTARFYMGLMWAQTGRPDEAFRLWRGLLEEGPEEAPWMPTIRSQIGLLAEAAGVAYTPPPAAAPGATPGPDAADMEAAADMTTEERQQMIRGMVDRLADRLAREGGPAEDWARLVSALGVLGETERAKAAYADARAALAGDAAALAALRAAAAEAGVAE
ncbi:c-type cytochrome biogenesis protein CcmI [Albidovulum sp.]|uniref:c-type cytochrome biogenesis protein CcmI n=1 Tax=Albidovulum sp. TaxID=1872424 RepID=UPI0039B89D60